MKNVTPTDSATPPNLGKIIGLVILVFAAMVVIAASTYIVQPGNRGVAVTLGRVAPDFVPEGFGVRQPFVTHIEQISVRQQTRSMPAECYSSDLQQVKVDLRVLYRIPERSVVTIYQQYAADPFTNLIAPRVQEALKEAAAVQSAEMFVKRREEVKLKALDLARRKIGPDFIEIADLVLYNMQLSPELETAIEQKMVQEQEAEKAKFTQLKTQIEADTAVIRAKGEAESIAIRGNALRENPDFLKLQVVQTWNGHSPLVVGAEGGANLLLQLDQLQHQRPAAPAQPAPRPLTPRQP
jgi:prohibitin 2